MLILSASLANSHADCATNYDSIYYNEDGSVEIITPRFNVENMNMRISDQTSLGAVCQKFGFARYVPNSIQYVAGAQGENLVRLDGIGAFSQYDSSANDNAISKLFCTNDPSSYVPNSVSYVAPSTQSVFLGQRH